VSDGKIPDKITVLLATGRVTLEHDNESAASGTTPRC